MTHVTTLISMMSILVGCILGVVFFRIWVRYAKTTEKSSGARMVLLRVRSIERCRPLFWWLLRLFLLGVVVGAQPRINVHFG
ncbi:hypothetical protein BDQ17DRAFT_1355528, partial [Cyathus striatus]